MEAAQTHVSLHLSKCHIVGNHVSRLIFRQGSVIMALDYWSVGNPDSRIRRSLESQFSEAMGDIRLGFSYQDAGTILYINP